MDNKRPSDYDINRYYSDNKTNWQIGNNSEHDKSSPKQRKIMNENISTKTGLATSFPPLLKPFNNTSIQPTHIRIGDLETRLKWCETDIIKCNTLQQIYKENFDIETKRRMQIENYVYCQVQEINSLTQLKEDFHTHQSKMNDFYVDHYESEKKLVSLLHEYKPCLMSIDVIERLQTQVELLTKQVQFLSEKVEKNERESLEHDDNNKKKHELLKVKIDTLSKNVSYNHFIVDYNENKNRLYRTQANEERERSEELNRIHRNQRNEFDSIYKTYYNECVKPTLNQNIEVTSSSLSYQPLNEIKQGEETIEDSNDSAETILINDLTSDNTCKIQRIYDAGDFQWVGCM
jgi:hypothetical protein